MSRERALRTLKFDQTDRIASMEWCTGLSPEHLAIATGIDARQDFYKSILRLIEVLEIDVHGPMPLLEQINGTSTNEKDERSEIHQKDWGLIKGSPVQDGARQSLIFNTPEDVLRFSPLKWDVKSEEDYYREFSTFHARNLSMVGNRCVVAEDIYTTLFHWCIDLFGWENFMLAAAMDQRRFEEILLEFKELSIKRTNAWARVQNVDFFMFHDDICMTEGPVFKPDWYEKYIFPHYEDIMMPLKKAGVPVIFISDGRYTSLVDSLANCGWDGFVFDHTNDFFSMVEKFGNKKILIGGADIRTLTFETPQKVREHIRLILTAVKDIRGFFYATAGSLTENIPMQNFKTYIEAGRKYRCKDMSLCDTSHEKVFCA